MSGTVVLVVLLLWNIKGWRLCLSVSIDALPKIDML